MKSYYSFTNIGDFKFKSSTFSDSNEFRDVVFKDTTEIVIPKIDKHLIEQKVEKKKLKLEKLLSKKDLIESRENLLNENPTAKNLNLNFCLNQKSNCKDCKAFCNYTLKDIGKLTKKSINEELKKHYHPANRTILKKQRNKQQAGLELIQHYKTIHNY